MSALKNIRKMFRLHRKSHEIQRFYNIDGFMLDLGEGHMLSLTKKEHPMFRSSRKIRCSQSILCMTNLYRI